MEGGGEKSEKGPLCTAGIYQARVGHIYVVYVGPTRQSKRQAASRQVTLVYTQVGNELTSVHVSAPQQRALAQ